MNCRSDTNWGLTEGSTTPQTHRGGWLNELLGGLPRIWRLRAAVWAFREAVTHGRDARATRARGLRGLLKEFFDRIRNPCETDVIKVNPAQSRSIKVESAGKRRFNLRPGRQTLSQRGLGHNRRLSRIRSVRSKFGRKRYFFAEVAPVFRAIADGWATGSRGRQINA